ncbi:MAG: hypothetical protein RLZZ592_2246 [Pseudomonadota bacterium]|jgi:hypothetical protein
MDKDAVHPGGDAARPLEALLGLLQPALGRTFGEIRFWGFAVVRPNDRCWRLESLRSEGQILCLGLLDAEPPVTGPATLAQLWIVRPVGLTLSSHGLTFERAERLGFDRTEAWPDGDGLHYQLCTTRGTARFEIQGLPALTLQA